MPKKLEIKKIVLNGNVSSGSAVITALSSTASLEVGDLVFGTGIPSTTRILSKDSSTQITLDKNATSGGTGVSLTFATDDVLVKNSDLLDGYHASITSVPSTIPVRDSGENIAAKSANLLWLDFAVNPGTIIETAGRVYYNNEDDTLNIVHASGAVQSVGQEFFFPPTNNNSGVQINNGEFVMATGAVGDRITIAKAVTNGTVDYIYMIGVATKNIPNGSESGKIITAGLIRNFNTNAWTVGTVLYPNPSVAGGWTSTKPSAPAIKTPIAIVVRQNSSSGILYVRMTLASKLGDTDSNVEFTSLADKQMFAYNGTNTRWENTNGLSWDFANGRLGIGTSTPSSKLDIIGDSKFQGNITLDGTPTTTNQNRGVYFTGFDKETTADFSDAAFIRHTVNIGGHSGSVLEISSQNDSADGIALTTNASSQIRHNGHIMWDANNDGAGSGLDADLLDGLNSTAFYLASNPSGYTTNAGTVTSVGLSLPNIFTVTNSPVTGSGTLTGTLANQNANIVFAGPSSGGAAAPTFRSLVAADIPTLNQNTTGTAANVTGTVAVANGGTGQTTYTNGQLLIGNTTGNTLTKATLTAGSGISITNGAGSITISSTVGSLNEITVTNDATGDIPFIINAITGTTALLQSWRVNNAQVARITADGSFFGNFIEGNYVIPNLAVRKDTDLVLESLEGDIKLYPYSNGIYVNDIATIRTDGVFIGPSVDITGSIFAGNLSISSSATTTQGAAVTANSLTSGNGLLIQSSAGSTMTGSLLNVTGTGAITTGDLAKFQNNAFVGSTTSGLVDILSTSTARANQSSLLNVSSSGANANATRNVIGGQFSVTNTGTASTNTALYLNASGGTTNRALNINSGEIFQTATANNTTTYRVHGNGYDVNLLRVSNSATTNSSDFGFSLRYIGTGTGNANYLDLYADNSTAGSQVLALRVDQAGTLTAGSTISHSGLVTTIGTNIDQLRELTTSSTTWTTTWQDITTVSGTYLATGSHTVLALLSGEYYTGNFSWFSGSTTSTTTDEIVLQRAGPTGSAARLFLRVARKTSGVLTLQASTSATITAAITLKFRRLI
jgi:hypothetical protein